MVITKAAQYRDLPARQEAGALARERTPLSAGRGWVVAPDRPDPVQILEEQNVTREKDLVPVRHGRMMVSPFTFYRGAARIMATDLAETPTAGLGVQLCGDAHLSNFGAYGSPERSLLFDLNDFDETLPGPFEYDVKRMVTSFTIAARNNGFTTVQARDASKVAVRAYRTSMQEFAEMRTLTLWYTKMSVAELQASLATFEREKVAAIKSRARKKSEQAEISKAIKAASANVKKTTTRDSLQALSKLAEIVDGRYRIISQPPILVPLRELGNVYGDVTKDLEEIIREQFRAYRATLAPFRQQLLDRFQIVDMARKVVGVGSVGTRAFIVLLQGRDHQDPLFLQGKEATKSVLEDHLPKSRFRTPGERVVDGQQLMQAASDIFLGWTKGYEENRYYYWRQLRDMKGSAIIENLTPTAMGFYAGMCGWTLARAHARSGDAVAIAEYLGTKSTFDKTIVDFAERYADQNERDYQAFVDAVKSGRISAVQGV